MTDDTHNPDLAAAVGGGIAEIDDSPFKGASRFTSVLATDPDLDPSVSHECHCLRCDYYWPSEPGAPFPPAKCARCRTTSWTTRPTPKQREALLRRNSQLHSIKEQLTLSRRRYWLARRVREILIELDYKSREVGDIVDECLAMRKATSQAAIPDKKSAREVLTSTTPQSPSAVAEAISTLLPPPPTWDIRQPLPPEPRLESANGDPA